MPFTPASPKNTPPVDGSAADCSEPLHCPGALIAALIRESDELAAAANRIGQQLRRYMHLELYSMPIAAHVAEHQQPPAFFGTQSPKAVQPLAEAKPAAKRPLSDFNFFCRDARKLVVEAHPDFTKEQVNRELGRIWSMLDNQLRQYYRSLHLQDKQRYTHAQAGISSTALHPAVPMVLDTSALRAAAQARQIIWRCITSPAQSNSIQSILNAAPGSEASSKSDTDEPFASIVPF
ncbi:hypothetical protein LPJ78_003383 [Coemansia sp. RSA 989]|nr:hypothetical protein BX667DRAFT_499017 [Coemansia mojavensis]KAJ1740663.1 hypothetical protein LPJ68_003550 [Coemansia sp. RSA 1086]KAJ1749264.1 hypothetical protein LPJ79_003864 [Coemansia sp. RSA 1821]KAJ1864429.1 hypothetical protein LPJ78_003383 [Coemansia sp. RSA 989]KAJ1871119.1 hypothetical protein LPJ55_004138 [Coemansia sp. RSA 990]KAJ2668963.1 hypothetical protein IWW42_004889 [Coemansia sp. RSA 1085]